MKQKKMVRKCSKCGGKGFVTGIGMLGEKVSVSCPKCFGTGKIL